MTNQSKDCVAKVNRKYIDIILLSFILPIFIINNEHSTLIKEQHHEIVHFNSKIDLITSINCEDRILMIMLYDYDLVILIDLKYER